MENGLQYGKATQSIRLFITLCVPGKTYIRSSTVREWIFHSIVYHLFQMIVYQEFSPKFTTLSAV